MRTLRLLAALVLAATLLAPPASQAAAGTDPAGHPPRAVLPGPVPGGTLLPNGWRLSPAGRSIATLGDLVTNLSVSPDGRVVVAINSGFLPHGLDVFDARTHERVQHLDLTSTFLGLAWSADGHTLFVSGGNASGSRSRKDPVAPIYALTYAHGRLGTEPAGRLQESIDPQRVWWSGIAALPDGHRLYAANRGTGTDPGNVVVFDLTSGQILTRIPVETSPYQVVPGRDGRRLFVSNWSSQSVSVIDTAANQVIRTLHVGVNPNDMALSADGRLFVACAGDNTVHVIDAQRLQVIERLSTTLTPLAPEGSTPDALAIDDARHLLYIANADNNSLAVTDISHRAHSTVVGFIPTGWYPSALALADRGATLYIGNAKGEEGHPDPLGPHTTLQPQDAPFSPSADASPGALNPGGIFSMGKGSVHTVQTSSIEVLPLELLRSQLPQWTRQVVENTPYEDSLLAEARAPQGESVIPQAAGAVSPIRHVLYIIKENRTYDQELGDLPGANGDARLTIFGETVTPNQHALARQHVILDNLYCDGEVSVDGHEWSTAAYATDFSEKEWPAAYAQISRHGAEPAAFFPAGGYLWDAAFAKGLTYRNYGEGTHVVKRGGASQAVPNPGMGHLQGHISEEFIDNFSIRDTDRAKIFLHELAGYEAAYDSSDPGKRLPNLIVMHLVDDHTQGTTPGAYTPAAMVAANDQAIGALVEGVSHSRYWPETAIFIIEDDAQDGSDHVDARRTVGLVISPYVKRGIIDSTLYTTSSMLRSIELLLGLAPMSQYDAAAMPLYASFGTAPMVTPFTALPPQIDINARNTPDAYGARKSRRMDFSQVDRAPMRDLNEILWKSVRGPDSPMPEPIHRFRPLMEVAKADDDDDH